MDNLVWIIYLIDVFCDGMSGLGFVLILLFALSAACYGSLMFLELSGEDELTIKVFERAPIKSVLVATSCLLFASSFIPSKETAYKMLAAYGVVEVAENENVQELMGDGMDILKATLKEYKKDLNIED